MRLRLLIRRLTVSAPRMAVRSALPWPLTWLLGALVLGFSAALALWAFEQGKHIAGVDSGSREEVRILKYENMRISGLLEKAQSLVNTSQSKMIAEQTAQSELVEHIRRLEADNQGLRDDLGFFEQLIPTSSGVASARIRSVQAEMLMPTQVRWQVLVIQAAKNPTAFKGTIELLVAGSLGGKPFSMTPQGSPRNISLLQYVRTTGVFDVPSGALIKSLTVKLVQNGAVKSVQTFIF
jgi:hypothetical protein